MPEELQEDTNKKYFFLGIGINIWMYFLAFFTLLFGNLMPVIIFGIIGAAFILMGISKRIRNFKWPNLVLPVNEEGINNGSNCAYFKGYYFNV
jgi:hypothetical protein